MSNCSGSIDTGGKESLRQEARKHHLHLRWHAKETDDQRVEDIAGGFVVACGLIGNVTGCTNETFSGRVKLELSGRAKARENLTLTWVLTVQCDTMPKYEIRDETLTMKFDSHGNLDHKASQLGKL